MFSKLNCYTLPTKPNVHKETKLQKYLRTKNEQIMEKCFNIKLEETVVKSNNETLKQFEETNKNRLAGQSSTNKDSEQQTCANISAELIKPKEENLQKTKVAEDETSVKAQKTIKNQFLKTKMQPSASVRITESSTGKHATATNAANSSNGSHKFITKTSPSKRTSATPHWKSPFRSFTTNGARTRLQRGQRSSEFAYDLSRDELKFAGKFSGPMRPAPETERQLLKSGQRREYLLQRYEHSPVVKYNYPEATSWRIGWLHQQQ